MICKNCGKVFPSRMYIDGERKDLRSRSFCIDCPPIGSYGGYRKGSGLGRRGSYHGI